MPGGLRSGHLKASVRVGVSRDAGAVQVTAMPGEDVVVLTIDGGPELTLHPETARDLLLAQADVRTARGAGPVSGEVLVPSTLRWPQPDLEAPGTRGRLADIAGGVILKAVDVVTGLAQDRAAEFVAGAFARRVDEQVSPGVYQLHPESLAPLKGAPRLERLDPRGDGGPSLVFIHGTFSNTSGAFGKLWRESPAQLQAMFGHYRGAVYGLDHPTLTVSPIANAITLAETLAPGTALHLVTHSRGGLVAEVIARLCGGPAITDEELRGFIPDQQEQIRHLAALLRERRITVPRIVRVACPARGTLLASGRVDAYLSVFKWTLELAGVAVLPQLLDFLGAVAQRREHADELPGLQAQIPDSALIQWLHAAPEPLGGELRVVAGDVAGDSLASWVKILVSDGFYWTDNDFVVQTRSMYGGARRRGGATYLLDQGGSVSHSAYFATDRAAGNVIDALLKDAAPGFRIVGPLSWKGESSTGYRAAVERSAGPGADKPAVFVIPGLAGSRLRADGQLLWPGTWSAAGLARLAFDPAAGGLVQPDGFVGDAFDALLARLSDTHDVMPFPYDWRLPLELEAARLADAIAAALDGRRSTRTPVRILAHGSGGILARVVGLVRPEVWEQLLAHDGARIVTLGTPHAGFWTPMQVLSGDDTFGGLLTAGAPPFGEADVRAVMGTLPGLLQLQAGLLDAEHPLGATATWHRLAALDAAAADDVHAWHKTPLQRKTYAWGLPTQDALDRAVALRRRLDAQPMDVLRHRPGALVVVAGSANPSVDGFEVESGAFHYLGSAGGGDGRVPLESALLPGFPAWAVDCEHGRMPRHTEAFAAYVDLLTTGRTDQLPAAVLPPPARGAAERPRRLAHRPSRSTADSVPEVENEILFAHPRPRTARQPGGGRALRVRVVNGDLTFVRQPLMLGHYRSMRLTGSELVMDALIGNTMSRSLEIGLYPEVPGTNQIFVNTHARGEDTTRVPRPEAVVVVGLGEEGKLNASALLHTVQQGTVAWAQRVAEGPGAPAVFDLAATLIGSGGKGMPVAQSAQLVAEAVRQANGRLAASGWPQVAELQLIELYLDRATEAWRALQLQAEAAPERYVVADTVTAGSGALRRPLDPNYRGADYDFISAVAQQDAQGRPAIAYTLDTKRARTEVTAQAAQLPLLSELVHESNSLTARAEVGRTLFNMLVPAEIEPFLGGSTEMVIELDGGTAGIPWELLDTNEAHECAPWAIRSKLIRKLRTREFRRNVADAGTEDRVLVIGEPQCDTTKYLRLPGARSEANAVAERLCGPRGLDPSRVSRLVSPDDETLPGPAASAVLSALYQHPWRIVHIAGHGEPASSGRLGGVVLSPSGPDRAETFLSAIEIEAMRVVPELVFVNCCHIAARDRQQLLAPDSPFRHHYDRPAFAAGLAEQLIRIGVRCVVVAGWAVDDHAAKLFATTFYDVLLRGARFIEAAAEARCAAWDAGGTTWAAYQCYGDPEWTFVRHAADPHRPAADTDWARSLGGISSPDALSLALHTMATKARFQSAPGKDEGTRLEDLRQGIVHLERLFGGRWKHLGHVAEAFGTARAEVGDAREAIDWYAIALSANDASASLRAVEQGANLRARLAWNRVEPLVDAAGGRDTGDELRAAAAEIESAIRPLKALVSLQSTMERESLIGASYKRIAMVWGAAHDPGEESAAIEQMRAHYMAAEQIGRGEEGSSILYPALNRLVADLALHGGDPAWTGLDGAALEEVRNRLAECVRTDPDFWTVVGELELRMYEAIASRRLAASPSTLAEDFEALVRRVPAPRMWGSVYDNARFVLERYARRVRQQAGSAEAHEARAATDLLTVLRRAAGSARAGQRAVV